MTTPITARMPYYFAPTNAIDIFSNLKFALTELESSKIDGSACFDNFKTNIKNELPDNGFANQAIVGNVDYQAFLTAANNLKTLSYENLLNNPNAATPLINDVEEKYQHFLKQQKLKFDQDCKAIPEPKRESLWSDYEKQLSSVYQPIAKFSQHVDPDNLLTHAMRYYVQKVMGKKNPPHSKLSTGRDNSTFTPRPQFTDSEGHPITVEYDPNGKVNSIRVRPHIGNVGDALAVSLASVKEGQKIPPIKIVCPVSNADILKSEMNVGPSLLIILLAHTLVKHVQQHKQKKQLLKGLFETGTPLKHISLEDNRGAPIPISHAEQEKLNTKQRIMLKDYMDAINKEIGNNNSHEAMPSRTSALTA